MAKINVKNLVDLGDQMHRAGLVCKDPAVQKAGSRAGIDIGDALKANGRAFRSTGALAAEVYQSWLRHAPVTAKAWPA